MCGVGRRPSGGMHIDRVRSRHTVSSGETRHYESSLLRRSYRKPDGKVGKQTLANLSMLPAAAVDAIDAVLKGKTLVEADAALQVSRSLPHGHVALVHAMATRAGAARIVGAGVPGTGPGLCPGLVSGGPPEVQAGDAELVE